MEAAQSLGKGDREEATREVGEKQEGPSRGTAVNRPHAAEMEGGRAGPVGGREWVVLTQPVERPSARVHGRASNPVS